VYLSLLLDALETIDMGELKFIIIVIYNTIRWRVGVAVLTPDYRLGVITEVDDGSLIVKIGDKEESFSFFELKKPKTKHMEKYLFIKQCIETTHNIQEDQAE